MNRLFPLVAASFLSACSAVTTIDEYRVNNSAMELNSNESVVILGRRDAGHYDTDREFIGCVADKMQGADISIMPEQQFVDAIYPWFEPRTAPKGLARLKRLMQDTTIKAEIDRQHIRYLVWLDGSTESRGQSGSMSCGAAPGIAGCFGFAQWDKSSTYEAIIWDLRNLSEKGRLQVDSQGTSYLIGIVAPIPLLSPVKDDACKSLGDQLLQFFSNPDSTG